MKKYLLLAFVAVIVMSCSNKPETQKKAEEQVQSYLKHNLNDAKSYQSVEFTKLDSLKMTDTKLYRDTETEKMRIQDQIVSLKDQMANIEKEGVKKSEDMYNNLKNELKKEEANLDMIDSRVSKLAHNLRSDYVYSVRHKYKAKESESSDYATYDETFIIDRRGNVIDVIRH